jgi:diguanylate cyclase (GGDEF)-like protein
MGDQGTKRSMKLYSALTALHEGIRRNLELEEMAGIAVKYLADLVTCQRCSVFLVGEGDVNIMAEMGNREELRETELEVEPLMEYFLKHPGTIFSRDFPNSVVSGLISDKHRFNSLVCAPVITDEGAAGFLLLGSRQKNAFGEDDGHLLELLAAELSTALKIALLQGKVRRLTVLDEVTGCFRREKFDEDIEIEIPCAERYGRPLSILLIAAEGAGNHIDSSDQSGGAAVLKQIGEILTCSIRKCDKLYRYGGEEFALMLPGIDRERAEFAAKRLLKVVSQKDIEQKSADLPGRKPVLHIGVASFPGDAVYREGLIKFLESDLQRAKQSGRNTAD